MIDHVTKTTWTQSDGKMGYCFDVYYTGRANRHYTYSFNDNLPMTVVRFLLDADSVETTYASRNKIEHYK